MDVGIDIGGTKLQGAFLRGDEIVFTARVATPRDYAELLAAVVALTQEAEAAVGEPVTRLGLGVPGTATAERVTWVPNLSYLDGQDLAGALYARVGAQTVVGNDAQFALLGELWRGAAQAVRDVVLISVGTGVGGAISVNGKLMRGRHGSAGAFGWLSMDQNMPPHPQHGHLELLGSGSALAALGHALDRPRSADALVAQARAGVAPGSMLVRQVAEVLGVGIASLASILDPDIIIFSGGLADAFDLLAEPIRAELRRRGSPSVRETPVVVSQLGRHAPACGALRAAMLQHAIWE